jgi:hypothetical protein
MAEGARGGICSVDRIESFMAATPRYQEIEEFAVLTG